MSDSSPSGPDYTNWLKSPIYWLLAIGSVFAATGWYTQSDWANPDVKRLLEAPQPAASSPDSTGTDPASASTALGAINITQANGSHKALSSYFGRWVLLDFWASWCPYCVYSLPAYAELAEKYPERLTLVAINTHEPAADASRFLRDEGMNIELLRSDQLVRELGVEVLPSTVLLDPQGRQVWAAVGYVPQITRRIIEAKIQP